MELTAFERRSFNSPLKSLREGGIFWQGLLKTCDRRHCLDASAWFLPQLTNCLYWSSPCLCLLFGLWDNRAERFWKAGQYLLCGCLVFTLRLHRCSKECHARSCEDPSLLRRLSQAIPLSSRTPPQWALPITTHWKACVCLPAGAFVSHEWTLRCIYVNTVKGRKEQIAIVWKCVCVCVYTLIQPFWYTHTCWWSYQGTAAALLM